MRRFSRSLKKEYVEIEAIDYISLIEKTVPSSKDIKEFGIKLAELCQYHCIVTKIKKVPVSEFLDYIVNNVPMYKRESLYEKLPVIITEILCSPYYIRVLPEGKENLEISLKKLGYTILSYNTIYE